MKQVIAVLIFCFATLYSQSQSIRFSPLSWPDALAKAKQEHKMLFIDMYTFWCTYCKQMDQTVFTTKDAGDYYNDHFINVRYDAQKADGIQIRSSYAMLGFPTFLYLSPDGLVMLKTAGYQATETFISNGDSAVTVWNGKR